MCRQQNVIWILSETDTHVNGMYVPSQSHPLGSGVVLVSHHEMESTVCGDWYTCQTYATQTTHPDTQWESDTADKLRFLCLGTAKDWGWKLAISSHMWLIYMYIHRLPSKKKLIYKCSSIFLQTETTQLSIKILLPCYTCLSITLFPNYSCPFHYLQHGLWEAGNETSSSTANIAAVLLGVLRRKRSHTCILFNEPFRLAGQIISRPPPRFFPVFFGFVTTK